MNFAKLTAVVSLFFIVVTGGRADSPDVQLQLNGSPAVVGSYVFPFAPGSSGLMFDNGLVRLSFNRDDAAGGIVTGWTTPSITATSIIANGTELAHNLNGVAPRDPDRAHSFYIDAGGGATRLVCTEVRVLRNTPDLAEVAFIDRTSTPLRHEHHLIMRRGKPGLYGYDILTAATATSISEVRMNVRWDRSIFDHAFNWERGGGQQPTYAYLATQTSMGDETWRIDGINNLSLPSPDSNAGNLPPGFVYTKYNWSLYHHENPMFGHYGHGFGAWLTPLGGVTDKTLCAFYGVGPNHQDLAIHQDALILNYFGPNHYGLPSYALANGYRRLYGPWFTFLTTGDPANPAAMIAEAATIAEGEIAENRNGSAWMNDALYPMPEQRATVTGRLRIADSRPADVFWVLLSTQNVTDVYTIHEPTYFVKTDADGNFSLPGVPPPTAAGTTNPSTYVLYIFASNGSVTDQYKQTGITIAAPTTDLGTITWAPTNHTTFLWQIGKADRMSGEFALATDLNDLSNPRAYEKPSLIPGNLTWTVGQSWEPENWYYAQTNAGVWTVVFNLDRTCTGTAFLTVSTSMQQGGAPTISVNGSSAGIVGSLPANNDSTIARQADRSGYPRRAIISFPASMLVVGANTITLTKRTGGGAGSGLGWDTLVLEADETTVPSPAQLSAMIKSISVTPQTTTWTVNVANSGAGPANDSRLNAINLQQIGGMPVMPLIMGRDPNRFPVPLGVIAPGSAVDYNVTINTGGVADDATFNLNIPISANGGRVQTAVSLGERHLTPIIVSRGGYSLNRRTGHIVQQVTVKNIETVPATGPIYLVLDNLSSDTTLANRSGITANTTPVGSSYVIVSNNDLAPATATTVLLEFTAPTAGGIAYNSRVLIGASTP
jgi:rhamnogalacturonan endolyase